MKKIILIAISFSLGLALNATTINFSAQVANSLAGVGGAALSSVDVISAGTWDGVSFTSLTTGSNDNVGYGPGFFSNSFGPTPSTAGAQLAFSWSNAGETAIIYYDIAAGDSTADNWTLKGGDGSGSDFNSNSIDVSDLTDAASGYTVLSSSAVLINAEFTGSNIAGVPQFNVVPEPSSYALLGGLFALTCVMLRRRA
jgi:hypothetical protein